MADPTGEANRGVLRLNFDRRLLLRFRGSAITSDVGLLDYRELDEVLALTTTDGEILADARTGKNGRHQLVGLLRQSLFGWLAGYGDVNDAERLCREPSIRWGGGGRAPMGQAASASQIGRFDTEWLTQPATLIPIADLLRRWIDSVYRQRPPHAPWRRILRTSSRSTPCRARHRPRSAPRPGLKVPNGFCCIRHIPWLR